MAFWEIAGCLLSEYFSFVWFRIVDRWFPGGPGLEAGFGVFAWARACRWIMCRVSARA